MGWFGPSKEEVWRQLCVEIGADFVEGGVWQGSKVQAHVGPWTLTLDTYTVSTGQTHITYTRMRAPYVNPEGFRFTIYRESMFSGLGRWFGMQDIEIGDPEFDAAFVIKGTDEARVCQLFAEPELRALVHSQRELHLSVKDSEGWFGPEFPDDVDELYFQVAGVITDKERLKSLFDLFAAILVRLVRISSAGKSDPGVTL